MGVRTPRTPDRMQVSLGGARLGDLPSGAVREQATAGGSGMTIGAPPGSACIIGPGGMVAGGVVRPALAAFGLVAHQLRAGAAGFAHHADGLGGAFEETAALRQSCAGRR
jgi:hypothetical protein